MAGERAAELEPIERASEDELRALQLQRLSWSLQHAYDNVPAYRGKCERAGVHPADLRRLEDLTRFPFTVKDDLRQLEVSREGALDRLRVRVGCVAELAADAAACTQLAARLRDGIKDRIGVSAEVAVELPGSLERPVGKARRVIDRRG
jgi:phenylacetate-coenzyme A ligase PaaK-like adenylate-forming protein